MARKLTAAEAAALIRDGMTVAVDGFIGFSLAEDILCELESRFLREGHPRDLRLVNVAGLGGDGKRRGINHFAHDGMLSRLFCSNLSLANSIYPHIHRNDFALFMAPQGVMSHMMRAISGKKAGVLTEVGLRTFVDPRRDGCRMNQKAWESGEEVVELVTLGGKEQLFFPAFPIDVCIIKGSTADTDGNISMENEAFLLEQYEMAAATHNSGGMVLVQVDREIPARTMNAKDVVVPACLVDYVIVGREENSRQQFVTEERWVDAFTGRVRVPLEALKPIPLNIKKVMARRAAAEIADGSFVNFGIGVPTLITHVLTEEKRLERVTLSIESGTIGGAPQGGLLTGAAYNADAMIKQPDIFDLYDGGGIDVACLGGAEFDREGNVNVSRFGEKIPGPGGFINITQCAKKVCFMGSFTAGESDIRPENGRLRIVKDGTICKFRREVQHITFSGEYSNQKGDQQVLYITERAVFRLTPKGLLLTEIAPGADLKRDILEKMEFEPLVADDLREMDPALFAE